MISVIDYGVSNLGSMLNMLRRIGVETTLVSTPADLALATKIILPGIGAYDQGVAALSERGLDTALRDMVIGRRVPLLGVCLGMQLLGESSEEGVARGLGFVPAKCVRFQSKADAPIKVPHMGWNTVRFLRVSKLSQDLGDDARFYFVHSYQMICGRPSDALAVTQYGGEVTAMVEFENIYGAQFHPEKSHRFGMQILKNFAEI